MNIDKKLNLNKYAFLNHLKGDVFNWLTCDENYYNESKKNDLLKNSSLWRFKKLNGEKVDKMEMPSQIISGNITSEWSRKWIKVNYPNHKIIEGLNWNFETSINKTNLWLDSDENIVIFEAGFKYKDFKIRVDILIKTEQKVEILELKGVTSPHLIHALDIFFQREIILRNRKESKNWKFELLIIDSEYIENYSYTELEKAKKLFIKSNFYLLSLSKPAKDKNNIKWTMRNQINSINNPNLKNKISKYQLLNDFFEMAEQKIISKNFDQILEKIKSIQLLNQPPKSIIEKRSFEYMDSDYMDYFFELAKVPKINSVFELKGGTTFSYKKKVNNFNKGIKFIKDLNNCEIVKKSISESLKGDEYFLETNSIINKLVKMDKKSMNGFGTIIQKHYINSNKEFMNIDGIKSEMKKYESGPIYMYDFETADLAIPLIEDVKPYQQIPYQFSIHVITNPKDYDFETLKNIIHYEWLAKDFNTFSKDFWKEFVNVFELHGKGVYVSWNMSFEKTRINEAIEMYNFDSNIYEWLNKIFDNTVDLMEIFKKKYYYHDNLHGSYSIKYVGPHFVGGKINYKKLNNIQKGDQSALEAKKWMITKNNEQWKNIRYDMLEYCKYDTLLMVAILQNMQKKFNNVRKKLKDNNIDKINKQYDLSIEQLKKWM